MGPPNGGRALVLVMLALVASQLWLRSGWAQDMRNATHNALFDQRMMGFSSSAG